MEWKKLRRSPTPRTQNIFHTAPAPPTSSATFKLGKVYYHRQFLTLQSDDKNFAVREFWTF